VRSPSSRSKTIARRRKSKTKMKMQSKMMRRSKPLRREPLRQLARGSRLKSNRPATMKISSAWRSPILRHKMATLVKAKRTRWRAIRVAAPRLPKEASSHQSQQANRHRPRLLRMRQQMKKSAASPLPPGISHPNSNRTSSVSRAQRRRSTRRHQSRTEPRPSKTPLQSVAPILNGMVPIRHTRHTTHTHARTHSLTFPL
jgi:hypothetical protein